MNRNRWLILLCCCLLLIGAVGSFLALRAPASGQVRVTRDGETLYTFDLNAAQDATFTLEYAGSYNIIQIQDGKIRMLEAGCPDNTCVNMGYLKSAALPIVCLPNHLVIEFIATDDQTDAIAR